ncbi:hypothetical protein [Bacillus cereus]|uniref:hypothetical protein n=1 Tax=Bacillus cereus TaxID=1396 RepID=UPI00211D9838|nr:hypothetical protein [Bacillus cereus]
MRHKHGKNSIMRSISYIKGPKQSERNGKVGGHKAYEAIQIMIGRTMMRWVSIKQEF